MSQGCIFLQFNRIKSGLSVVDNISYQIIHHARFLYEVVTRAKEKAEMSSGENKNFRFRVSADSGA